MSMKKVALLLLCGVILIGGAGAYIITLSAPKTINAGEILISRMCLRIGGASFFGLSPPQIDAVRAWLTEQGHEFVDAAAEEA